MRKSCNILIAALLAALISCAGPPKSRIERIYEGLSEPLPRLDPTVLKGREILIDPGHGGHFRGAFGQDSLEESLVNLGVSLYLWGLLNEAGAEVTLTRSAERDFLSEEDSSLVTDLQARVSLACSLQPDLLISIHHNAHSQRDAAANAVETYYRTGDPASLDLAFSIHRHLMRNLGISEGEVRQGNYYILRSVDVPAVLGEASYLTHPLVERKLRLTENQRLEAEAYFLGILEYFHRGVPRLQRWSPAESILTATPMIVFEAEDIGGLGIDPDAIFMNLNDRTVEPVFDQRGRIMYQLPWDAPNQPYRLLLNVRNLLGNSSRVVRYDFAIDFPPETAVFDFTPAIIPPGGGLIRAVARLLDRRGLAISDGTPVEVSVPNGDSTCLAFIRNGFVEFPIHAPPITESLAGEIACREKRFAFVVEKSQEPAPLLRSAYLRDSLSGAPIVQASILHGDSVLQTGSSSGLYFLPAPEPTDTLRAGAPGYHPLEIIGIPTDTLSMMPWFEGKLIGKRFLIDPEGGPLHRSGAGILGLSGSHVNLQVARYLANYLRLAGGEVGLTRESEETRTPQDIVVMANRIQADRYLEIRHRSLSGEAQRNVQTFYFPGSQLGMHLAAEIAVSLSDLTGLEAAPPAAQVTIPLQQTACAAVIVEGPTLAHVEEEIRLGEAWYQRLQAYGIFIGILHHYGVEEVSSLRVRITGTANPSNWLVVVDDTWRLLTSPSGTVEFRTLSGGAHKVEIQREQQRLAEFIDLAPDTCTEIVFDAGRRAR